MVREYAKHMRNLAYEDMLKLLRGVTDLETRDPIIDGQAKFIFSDYYNARVLYYSAKAELNKDDEKMRERLERKRDSSMKLVMDFEDEKGIGIARI